MKHFTSRHQAQSLCWLVAWLALLALPSCRKNPDTKVIIHGRVTEYGTSKPVADARIYVLCYDGVIGSPSSYLTDSILTDADGRFYREYEDAVLCDGVYLIPYKEGYYKGSEIDLTTDNLPHEVVLDPEAWLKIVTVPDMGIYHLDIGGNFLGAASFVVYASDGNQEHYFQTSGNRTKHIFWMPWGELDQAVFDSIYVQGLDTTIYTIHY